MPYTADHPAANCPGFDDGFFCTGELGHDDDHAAYGMADGEPPVHTWPHEKA